MITYHSSHTELLDMARGGHTTVLPGFKLLNYLINYGFTLNTKSSTVLRGMQTLLLGCPWPPLHCHSPPMCPPCMSLRTHRLRCELCPPKRPPVFGLTLNPSVSPSVSSIMNPSLHAHSCLRIPCLIVALLDTRPPAVLHFSAPSITNLLEKLLYSWSSFIKSSTLVSAFASPKTSVRVSGHSISISCLPQHPAWLTLTLPSLILVLLDFGLFWFSSYLTGYFSSVTLTVFST